MIVSSLAKRLVAFALVLAVSLSAAGPALAETVPVSVNIGPGQLSLQVNSTQAVALQGAGNQTTLPYSSSAQSATGSIGFIVDDGRSGASGWNVTAQITNLTGDANISIANTGITATTNAITKLGGSDQLPQSQSSTAIDQPKKVLVAGNGAGAGRYSANLNLNVAIPGYSRPGSYSATVTVSLIAGP